MQRYKLHLVAIVLAAIFVSSTLAQQVKPKKKEPLKVKKGDRIAILGESIAEYDSRDGNFVAQLKTELNQALPDQGIEVLGVGVSGDKILDLQKRLDDDVLSKKPAIVIIYVGKNDVWHSLKSRSNPSGGTSPEDFKTGLSEMVNKCQEAGAKVLLCTPTVVGEKKAGGNDLDKMLDEFAELTRAVAKETKVELLDLRKEFKSRIEDLNKENLSKGVLTFDGVLLNEKGNQLVAQQLLAALRVPIPTFTPDRKVVYKTIGDTELKLHVFEPKDKVIKKGGSREVVQETNRPAAVFFFGGGWNGGKLSQFYPHCQHLADQGIVAMAAEYRVKSRNGTTPFECVMDGNSAIRWVRNHASELRIDPKRIIAGGGSAGGHVAAATGTVPGLIEAGEDTQTSSLPNALILFNPVYDNGPGGYGHERVKDRYTEISPMHNISSEMPPAIVFLGTKDKFIPVKTAEKFRDKMKQAGVRSELKLYEGATHGFFNAKKKSSSDYRQTIMQMDDFLNSLGYFD